MIDIFNEREQPKLYIADIFIGFKRPVRSKHEKFETRIYKANDIPILLVDNRLPTKKYEDKFFRNIFDNYIKTGEYDKYQFRINKIENIRFSSNINYKFNYNTH
jgi:hypothetical protein